MKFLQIETYKFFKTGRKEFTGQMRRSLPAALARGVDEPRRRQFFLKAKNDKIISKKRKKVFTFTFPCVNIYVVKIGTSPEFYKIWIVWSNNPGVLILLCFIHFNQLPNFFWVLV